MSTQHNECVVEDTITGHVSAIHSIATLRKYPLGVITTERKHVCMRLNLMGHSQAKFMRIFQDEFTRLIGACMIIL